MKMVARGVAELGDLHLNREAAPRRGNSSRPGKFFGQSCRSDRLQCPFQSSAASPAPEADFASIALLAREVPHHGCRCLQLRQPIYHLHIIA